MSCLGNAAMNPAQLLAHFDRISEAPDAIPRLRRFILDLAVRGKLVEQDQNDEPAGELLKRIQEEKAKRIKAGEMRSPRVIEWTDSIEKLFPVFNSWAWVRLADVGAIVGGGTPQSNDADNFTAGGTGIAWLTPADLGRHNELYVSHGSRDITEKGLKSSSATLIPKDSVLFTSRAPIGYTAISANEITTNQGFKSVVPYITECSRYIALYLKAFGPWIDSKASGTTFREVSGKVVSGLPIPLPPLPEQHRIVAKVDELMALCDQLEAAKAERENQRDRLIAASLHRLNSSDDADASRESARFYLNHLPRLTTRPEHIKQLRQTILNLAVRGRLVPQDPNDELAGELLKRIQEQKAMLVKSGEIREIRKGNLLPLVDKNQTLYSLPTGWEWTRLGVVCFLISDGTHHTPKYENSGIHFLSVKDVSSGSINFSNTRFISEATHLELCKRCKPEFGDILLTKVGTTGIAVTVDTTQEFSIFVSLALLKFSQINLDGQYLRMLINSPFVRQQSADNTQGIGNKNLVLRLINQFSIPLPPLAEQHRIVAKVDELMALCDQLETQLTTTQTDNRRLLEALLHRALEEPDLIPFLSRL